LMRAFGISMGSSAQRALNKRGEIGWIHSVFHNALYILTGDWRLIGVVGPRSYNMPINLKVWLPKGLAIGDLGLSQGIPVRRSGDLLMIGGDLSVDLRGVRIWKPVRKPLEVLDEAGLSRSIKEVEDAASERASAEGFGPLISHREGLIANDLGGIPSDGPMISKAARGIASLFKAVKERDPIGIDRSVTGLVGLGPGLTPSGDDFLTGFLASLVFGARGFPHRFSFPIGSLRGSVLRARASTTLVSREFLLHAVEGEVAEPVNDLIAALFDGSPQLRPLTHEVVDMGETSGCDIALGVIVGASLFIQSMG
jgi:hypothetical protein